ncbi:Dr family adhesin structural subunit [Providencia alcalifaciens]|uniref:Dr family adhesin structural subunit n=1 Tax=Providencia alcalifaciens TaxID=126385 RepID=UPI0015D0B37A|nr:Dr family adhesin structural subunit [Providencia alcalifaciens]MBF0693202.1 Dr family adhesin structural subunit [Providencia alcalifaciens]NYS91706.1 Dr family adhesin structural subunit [Providencia alcalifaciens]
MVLMLALVASSGIANAATKSATTQLSADFEVVAPCTVSGSWDTQPLTAGNYPAGDAQLGRLTLTYDGCGGRGERLYFEGTDKDGSGRTLATGPRGQTLAVGPVTGPLWNKTPDGTWYSFGNVNGGSGTMATVLTNSDQWDAQPGDYSLTLDIGLFVL